MSHNIVAGIDIGSSKITSIIAEFTEDDIIIKGINAVPTKSIVKGMVRDINTCSQEIDASFSGAVYSSGVSVEKVYLSVVSKEIFFKSVVGEIDLGKEPRELTHDDVEKLLASVNSETIEEGYERFNRVIQYFTVNEMSGVRNPVGMYGTKLSLTAQDVIGPTWLVNNYRRAVERVGLEVIGVIPSALCAGHAVSTEEELETGSILLDLGHGTTNIAVFRDGAGIYMSILTIGGANLDTDIMHGLGVGLEEAQRIKKAFVKAWVKPEQQEMDELIDVKLFGQRKYSKMKKQKLIDVVVPRLEEWAQLINKRLTESGYLSSIPGGIILVGGGCHMREIVPFFQHHLKRAVRIGLPIGFSHLFDEFRAPQYASALGIASFARLIHREIQAYPLSFIDEAYRLFTDFWNSLPWVKRKTKE